MILFHRRISLNEDQFEEFNCPFHLVTFTVPLNVLLDCFHLLGSSDNINASLSFSSTDNKFRISLEESGVITRW